MGLCPSRQNKKEIQHTRKHLPAPRTETVPVKRVGGLRADAPSFKPTEPHYVPTPGEPYYVPKEPWEMFLAAKEELGSARKQHFTRRADGMFTSEYRRLLGEEDPKATWPTTKWGNRAPVTGTKKRKPSTLKKAIIASRTGNGTLMETFEQHLHHVLSLPSANGSLDVGRTATKDDSHGPSGVLPYGLAALHYHSDGEDAASSHRHPAFSLHVPVREYVTEPIDPGLEKAVIRLLYELRAVKMAERSCGIPRRRYTVGFREVTRMLTSGSPKALIVAPDVERSAGALEAKIASLVDMCKGKDVPVVYALSRRQLGAAICKNVAVSVFGVEDAHGCEALYEEMVSLVPRPERLNGDVATAKRARKL